MRQPPRGPAAKSWHLLHCYEQVAGPWTRASQVDPIGDPIRYETERDPVATRVVICDRLTHEVAEAASGN